MASSRYIKNATGGNKTYVGQLIGAGEYYLIQEVEWAAWSSDSTLLCDVATGDALVAKSNDGSSDIADISEAITYLKALPGPLDTDGAPLSRVKVTKLGWSYQEHSIELTTAKTGSVYNSDKDGTDLGFTTLTLYDAQDAVTTVEADAVKTIITWEPTYTYQIIGSKFFQSTVPTNDLRMYVTAVPDYPAPSGSIVFVQGGVNFKHLGTGQVLHIDGRSAKKLKYNDPVAGTNKFEMIFHHSAGDQCTIQIIVEMFKS